MTLPILEDVVNGVVKELRNEGSILDSEVLAILRREVMDPAKVAPADRTKFVKLVNAELKTEFTLNKIRRANPSQLKKVIAKKEIKIPNFEGTKMNTPVMHNGEAFDIKGNAAFAKGFKELRVEDRAYIYREFANVLGGEFPKGYTSYLIELRDHPLEVIFYSFLESNDLWDTFMQARIEVYIPAQVSWEDPKIKIQLNSPDPKIVQLTKAELLDSKSNTSTVVEQPTVTLTETITAQEKEDPMETIKADVMKTFIKNMELCGHNTMEKRKRVYDIFVGIYPEHQVALNAAYLINNNFDEVFFEYIFQREEATAQFYQIINTSANANKTGSVNGEAEQNAKWFATGAAVLTVIGEAVTSGNVTVGSAVGGIAGIGLAYFAQDVLTRHVDHTYGKYAAAIATGSLLGLGGATAGRMAEGKLVGMFSKEDVPVVIPSITIPSFISAPTEEVTVIPTITENMRVF